jgi:hypothetical protein
VTTYRIRASLLCHDVRLNTSIETLALFDHVPSEEEALRVLYPIADARVARDFCEGCNYHLSVFDIQAVDPPPAQIAQS